MDFDDPELLAELEALGGNGADGDSEFAQLHESIVISNSSDEPKAVENGSKKVSAPPSPLDLAPAEHDHDLLHAASSSLSSLSSLLTDPDFESMSPDVSHVNDDETADIEGELSSLSLDAPVQTQNSSDLVSTAVTPEMINSMKQEMFALNSQGKVREAGAMRKKIKELEARLVSQPDVAALTPPSTSSTSLTSSVVPLTPPKPPASSASTAVTPEMINNMKQEMFALNSQGKVREAGAMRKKIKELEEKMAKGEHIPSPSPAPASVDHSPPTAAPIPPESPVVQQSPVIAPVTTDSGDGMSLDQQAKELRARAVQALKAGDKQKASQYLREAMTIEAQTGSVSSQPVVTVSPASVNNIEEVIGAKRREAVEHQKAGRIQDARNAMKEAKRLEASHLNLGKEVGSSEIDYASQWSTLQQALTDVISEHKNSDAGDGTSYKAPSSDLPRLEAIALEVSKRRTLPNAIPPKFQLERVSRQREVVISALRSEELVVEVKGLEDMVDDEGKKLLVEISIDTALVVDENNPPPVSISHSATIERGTCLLNHSVSFPVKRSQRHARKYEKRGLDIVLKSKTKSYFGLSSSEEVLAEGKMKLLPLVNKCFHQEAVSLHLPGQARKMRRGTLSIQLRTHHPIGTDGDGKDIRSVTMTNLAITSWGNGESPLTKHTPTQSKPPQVRSSTTKNHKVAQTAGKSGGKVSMSPAQLKQFGQLSDQERKMPLSAPHIVSEAVLNHLLATSTDPMVTMTLKNQMLILQVNFDSGNLTPQLYLSNLEARISRDILLTKYLIATNRRPEAAKVMERTKIMKSEIGDVKTMLSKQG